jgi:flagellar M-ring protein FliF
MDFKVLFSQLIVLYSRLTKQQRIIIASAIIGIVAFLIFLVVFTSKRDITLDYEVLFDSLSSEDAAKVIAQLEKDEVPYVLLDKNVIKVPKKVVYKERISIAAQGIPNTSGVGFELFDKQEFGATSFDQNVKYLRALEGELSRTINSLSPIENATVSLAIPKDTLFISKQEKTTASVMIEIVEGRRLSSKQIRGIKNLVASAVPKLSPAGVMLIDSDGETLGDDEEMAQMSELSITQQKFKTKQEKKKQRKIIQVISPFVGGEEKVVAQVTIEYDFSIENSTSETYDPENVVRSEQISEEKREGSAPAEVGGVPGTVSNIGPVQGLTSNQTNEKYEKNTGTTNYEIGKTVSNIKSQFARIKRITAAVIVDGKYKYKKDKDGENTSNLEYEALSKSDLDALVSLVSRSIGINENRGDLITVKNLQFKRTDDNIKEDGMTKIMTFTKTYLSPLSEFFKYLFVLILLFILYKKAILPFSEKMLILTRNEEDIEKPHLNIDDDEGEDLITKVQQMRKKVEDQLGVSDGLNEDELKYEVLLEKIKVLMEDSPEEISALLESLVKEESDSLRGF